MQKGTKYALLCAAVPFITLAFALPLINRIEPLILGLPFVLFWIILWVALTPVVTNVGFGACRCQELADLSPIAEQRPDVRSNLKPAG